jgi:beta-phosphoglucomutase-like phosphatase (HAD superfamily)
MVLERLGRGEKFGAVVTGADVTRGKPNPQVFQIAAQRLGVAPAKSVVVEDAPAGIDAAHAAGMSCVALVSTGRVRETLEHADLVVDSLQELNAGTFVQLVTR